MANEEHVALLKQGMDAWNAWRHKNPDILLDLSHADLNEAKLNGTYLCGANLSGAGLFMTDLREADLREADLSAAIRQLRFSHACAPAHRHLLQTRCQGQRAVLRSQTSVGDTVGQEAKGL